MSSSLEPLKTCFYDFHLAAGGKMVPFAGYQMPINYSGGIIDEHLHTRDSAGLFDVSHMGQVIIRGPEVASQLEKLMPVDIAQLGVNQMTYSTLTNAEGGILDDLIITRWDQQTFFIVVNAACKQQDIAHFKAQLPDADITVLSNQGLLALQGPQAAAVLEKLAPESAELTFMQGCSVNINGAQCYITRSGYTGEDGFEISIKQENCAEVANYLLADNRVRWVGLGARDSLRLEAGLCLYGHDMDQQTSPIEASLSWSISKSRRNDGAKQGGFLGANKVLAQTKNGVDRKRVGFIVDGRAPVREGADIVDLSGAVIGAITSGGFSPSLQKPIAMGYIASGFSSVNTQVNAMVRGKLRPMTITKMPFVPQRYYRG